MYGSDQVIDYHPHYSQKTWSPPCTQRVSDGQLLCKCRDTSTVCTGEPEKIVKDSLDLDSFAEEVIEDVFNYNAIETYRSTTLGTHTGNIPTDESFDSNSPKARNVPIFIKKTNKIASGNGYSVPNSASNCLLEIIDEQYPKVHIFIQYLIYLYEHVKHPHPQITV